jgi:hypothetical protein
MRYTLMLSLVLGAAPAVVWGEAPLLTPDVCARLTLAPAPRRSDEALPPQQQARPGPLAGVRRIVDADTPDKVKRVKQVIAKRQHAVALHLRDPDNRKIIGDLWVPSSEPPGEGGQGGDRCRGTMVAVGYDDARYGGAFEVMRDCGQISYGESVVWVRYDDFSRLGDCAVELVASAAGTTTTDTGTLAGTLRFEDASGSAMPARWTGQAFRMPQSYPAGAKFRVAISSTGPAHVYAVGADSTHAVFLIYPTQGSTAFVGGGADRLTLPPGGGYFEMDAAGGTDYFCVLFSTQELDAQGLADKLAAGSGDLLTRLQLALGDALVPPASLRPAASGEIGLSAPSQSRSIVPIIVEIPRAGAG